MPLITLMITFSILLTAEGKNNGCLHPPKGAHVVAQISRDHQSGMFPVNTTISYSCDPEYDILNKETRRCLPNGTWSGMEPYCGINVATTATVQSITTYDNSGAISRFDRQDKNQIITGFYTDCISIKGKEAIFTLQLNKTYTVDLIKLAFKNPNKLADYPIPTIHYSSVITRPSKWTNIILIKNDTETVDGSYFSTFEYVIDTSVKSRLVILKVEWPNEKEFDLCEISTYSNSELPESWCSFNSDKNAKHFSYGRQCFAVYPIASSWTEAFNLCAEYKKGLNSSLIKSYSNPLHFYIRLTIARMHFNQSHIWYLNPAFRDSCFFFRLSSKTTNANVINCYSFMGRICQYNLHRCGTPDQQSGSLLNLNGSTATYNCPPNFALVGNLTRICLNGQWTFTAPKCICDFNYICLENCKTIAGAMIKVVAIILIVQWILTAGAFFYLKCKLGSVVTK